MSESYLHFLYLHSTPLITSCSGIYLIKILYLYPKIFSNLYLFFYFSDNNLNSKKSDNFEKNQTNTVDIINELKSDPFDLSNASLQFDNEEELSESQQQKLLGIYKKIIKSFFIEQELQKKII